jgi:hypothetical protein
MGMARAGTNAVSLANRRVPDRVAVNPASDDQPWMPAQRRIA